jgi:2'-5' RNA ligase
MPDHRDHHATIFVPPEVAGPLEAIRREWDPGMASRIASHVTLVYPHEAPNPDLLYERVREACSRFKPFRLRLRGMACLGRPEGGVYVEVDDVDGGYGGLREEVLRTPFQAVTFRPHVTLVHPRTSCRGRDFWDRRRHERQDREFTATEIAITAFDGDRWVVLAACTLAGPR